MGREHATDVSARTQRAGPPPNRRARRLKGAVPRSWNAGLTPVKPSACCLALIDHGDVVHTHPLWADRPPLASGGARGDAHPRRRARALLRRRRRSGRNPRPLRARHAGLTPCAPPRRCRQRIDRGPADRRRPARLRRQLGTPGRHGRHVRRRRRRPGPPPRHRPLGRARLVGRGRPRPRGRRPPPGTGVGGRHRRRVATRRRLRSARDPRRRCPPTAEPSPSWPRRWTLRTSAPRWAHSSPRGHATSTWRANTSSRAPTRLDGPRSRPCPVRSTRWPRASSTQSSTDSAASSTTSPCRSRHPTSSWATSCAPCASGTARSTGRRRRRSVIGSRPTCPTPRLDVLEGAGHCFVLPRWTEILAAVL